MNDIPFVLKRSSRRKKTAQLTISPEGKVVVTAPHHMSESYLQKFVNANQSWIEKQKQKTTKAQTAKRTLIDGEYLPYKGGELQLKVVPESLRSRSWVKLQADSIAVYIPVGLRGAKRQDTIRSALENWYIKQARQTITDQTDHYAAIMGLSYNRISIKDTSSRWGSCSSAGNLNFSWRLILAPPNILDYVVIHELAHLVHQNHQPPFWNLVAKYDSLYKDHRKYLKQNGWRLTF